jgi:hypothetical protein
VETRDQNTTVEERTELLPRTTYSVAFHPSSSSLIYALDTIQQRYKLPQLSGYALNTFLIINGIAVPALLLYAEWVMAAAVIFGANLIALLLIVPSIARHDLRRYLEQYYPTIEDELIEITLDDRGVHCRADGDSSSTQWKNVLEIEETRDAIYLYRQADAIVVNKTGFAYDDQKNQFLAFARSHVGTDRPQIQQCL